MFTAALFIITQPLETTQTSIGERVDKENTTYTHTHVYVYICVCVCIYTHLHTHFIYHHLNGILIYQHTSAAPVFNLGFLKKFLKLSYEKFQTEK